MGYKTVEFLGEQYEVSEAINEYLGYEAVLEEVVAGLFQEVSSHIQRDATFDKPQRWMDWAETDYEDYKLALNKAADRFVGMLVDRGIYDVSVETLTKDVSTYDDVHKLTYLAMSEILEGAKNIYGQQQAGLSRAYQAATGSITGSGFCVFSSSLATLAAFSIAEGSILLSQAKKADEEYSKAARELSAKALDEIDELCARVLANEYYPALPVLFTDFGQQVMSAFLAKLYVNDQFDYQSVQQYSMRKTESMLTHLSRVEDKRELLRQSFLSCPFCLQLYEKTFEAGLMDCGTLATAEYFGFGEALYGKAEQQCRATIGDPEKFDRSIELLAYQNKVDRAGAFSTVFKDEVRRAQERYGLLDGALKHDSAMQEMISQYFTPKASALCNMGEEDIAFKVREYLGAIVDRGVFDRFKREGLLGELGVPGEYGELPFDEMNAALGARLKDAVLDYARRIRPHAAQKSREHIAMAGIFNARLEEYNVKKRAAQDKIAALKADIDGAGLFAFSKKKELRAQVSSIEGYLDELEVAARLTEMRAACDAKMAEMHDLDYRLLTDAPSALDGELPHDVTDFKAKYSDPLPELQ